VCVCAAGWCVSVIQNGVYVVNWCVLLVWGGVCVCVCAAGWCVSVMQNGVSVSVDCCFSLISALISAEVLPLVA